MTKAPELSRLEERLHSLLRRSQDESLLREVLSAEAVKAERLLAEAKKSGLADSIPKNLRSGRPRLSTLFKRADRGSLSGLASRLVLLARALQDPPQAEPASLEAWLKEARALPDLPWQGGSGALMKFVYYSPAGERVWERQREILLEALAVYSQSRELVRRCDSGLVGALMAASGGALSDFRGAASLCGARLAYYLAAAGLMDEARSVLKGPFPAGRGPQAAGDLALAWRRLIFVFCRRRALDAALAALAKLSSLQPYPEVLTAYSEAALQIMRSFSGAGEGKRAQGRVRGALEEVYAGLLRAAPPMSGYERPGVIRFVPADPPWAREWPPGPKEFLDDSLDLWGAFAEDPGEPDLELAWRGWPFRERDYLLDYYYSLMMAAKLLYGADSARPDLEEIEDTHLMVLSLKEGPLANLYRFMAAADLCGVYAEFGEFDKARFCHGVLFSYESAEKAPEGGGGRPGELPAGLGAGWEKPRRGAGGSDYSEARIFSEVKSIVTMRLIDLFFLNNYRPAARPGKGASGKGAGRAPKRRRTEGGRLISPKKIAGGASGLQEFDFDSIMAPSPALAEADALSEAGEFAKAARAVMLTGDLPDRDAIHFLHTCTRIMLSMGPEAFSRDGKALFAFMTERRRFPASHVRNYASYSCLKILLHIRGFNLRECSDAVLGFLYHLWSQENRERSLTVYTAGIARIMRIGSFVASDGGRTRQL